MSAVPFIDLAAQQAGLPGLQARIAAVLARGQFILGPEVAELESALATRGGVAHAVTCASGTDALQLALMARNIGAGDAVFVPSFTFAASAEAVALLGATPVFVDVREDTFNMDAASLEQGVARAKAHALRPAAVMPVDMFGQPADYDAIGEVAAAAGAFLLCDAAQSFGASWKGKPVGGLGLMTATSFFPSKPLGCYGDGGAVFTDDADLRPLLASLRAHGQGSHKYDHARIGLNSRLDTLQAAILLEKLTLFDAEMEARQRVASRYSELLSGMDVPVVAEGAVSAWAQYTVKAKDEAHRARIQQSLSAQGIPSMIYYPVPMHRQAAYAHFPTASGAGLPVCEQLCARVISLPMHPYLLEDAQARVAKAVLSA